MSISKVRGWLYFTAKILGDIQAAAHKDPAKAIPKRIARRIVGKGMGRIMRALIPPTNGRQ